VGIVLPRLAGGFLRGRLSSNVRPHVNTATRLSAHLLAFLALLAALRPSTVAPVALVTVYVAGALFLLLAPRSRLYPRWPRTWLTALGYALLLATVFAGADFTLGALGNSAKPRAPLPTAFGGLELYWLLVFGVASVAAGALPGVALERRQQPQTKPSACMGRSQ